MNGLLVLIVLFVLVCLAQHAYAKVESIEFSDGTFLTRFVTEDLDFMLSMYLAGQALAEKNKCRFLAIYIPLAFGAFFSFVATLALFGNAEDIGYGWAVMTLLICAGCVVTLAICFFCPPCAFLQKSDSEERADANIPGYLTEAAINQRLRKARDRFGSIIGQRDFFLLLERPYPKNGAIGPEACFIQNWDLPRDQQPDQFASTIRDIKDKLAAVGITEKKRGTVVKKHWISEYPVFLDVFSADTTTTTTIPPTAVAGSGPVDPTPYPVAPPAAAGYAPPQMEQPAYPTAPAYAAQDDQSSGRGYETGRGGDVAIEMERPSDRTV